MKLISGGSKKSIACIPKKGAPIWVWKLHITHMLVLGAWKGWSSLTPQETRGRSTCWEQTISMDLPPTMYNNIFDNDRYYHPSCCHLGNLFLFPSLISAEFWVNNGVMGTHGSMFWKIRKKLDVLSAVVNLSLGEPKGLVEWYKVGKQKSRKQARVFQKT